MKRVVRVRKHRDSFSGDRPVDKVQVPNERLK